MGSAPAGAAPGRVLLSVENLFVRRGSVEILKGVSLEIREGEIAALIGANGAGKSTLLMAISGILPVKDGSIRFLGEELRDLPPDRRVSRGVTQVPEGRRIFPRLTVLENLQIGGSLRQAGAELRKDLEWVLELFPVLRERQRQLAGTLSGGEQQMLAIGRGLMARPKLLMLDEPSLGLAPKAVSAVFEVIRAIHKAGVTLLLVEQNAFQALRVAQTAAVLETGCVVLSGPAADLRENPAVRQAYLGGG